MISNGDSDANSNPDSNNPVPRRRRLRPRFRVDTGTDYAQHTRLQGAGAAADGGSLLENGDTSNNIDSDRS
jgi:hypothetical protein